jgi:hypothetical protein
MFGVDMLAFHELLTNLLTAGLPVEVRNTDGPVQQLIFDHDVYAMAIIVEWRQLIRQAPDLSVLGVKNV